MGRKKKVLSPEELEARKTKWWGPERNARRRERYQKDAEYRAKAIQQARDLYKRERLAEGSEAREEDCRINIPDLPQIGVVRELRVDDEHSVRMLTFTCDDLARAVSRNPQVIYRWMQAELLPTPIYKAKNHRNRWQEVYTVAEVRAIMGVFGEHQKTSQYYRSFHTDTRDLMVAAVKDARDAMATKIANVLAKEKEPAA